MNHMGFLQTLELEVEYNTHLIRLLHTTGQLRELTIFCDSFIGTNMVLCLYMVWKESQFKPSCFNVVVPESCSDIENLIKYVTQHIPAGITANFRVYNRSRKVPLNFSPTFPYFQLRLESDQVTTPFVKLSGFGILGLNNVVSMTDCQYGGQTMYRVKRDHITSTVGIGNSSSITCVTHFDFTSCSLLRSGHLEQIAITCPNLQIELYRIVAIV